MRCHVASTDRSAALRSSHLSLAKTCAIGLKSGEYGAGTRASRRPSLTHDPPHRPVARHPPRSRSCLQPTQQPLPLTGQRTRLLATHRSRCRTPRHPQTLRPLHRTRNAHPKQSRRHTRRSTTYNRRSHPLPKIIRISSRHPYWPPIPASRLNQNSTLLGIPSRFKKDDSDSSRALLRFGRLAWNEFQVGHFRNRNSGS